MSGSVVAANGSSTALSSSLSYSRRAALGPGHRRAGFDGWRIFEPPSSQRLQLPSSRVWRLPGKKVDELEETCSLRVADRAALDGGTTLEWTGEFRSTLASPRRADRPAPRSQHPTAAGTFPLSGPSGPFAHGRPASRICKVPPELGVPLLPKVPGLSRQFGGRHTPSRPTRSSPSGVPRAEVVRRVPLQGRPQLTDHLQSQGASVSHGDDCRPADHPLQAHRRGIRVVTG